MTDLRSALGEAVGIDHVLSDSPPEYGHDESLTVAAVPPAFVVRPGSTAEVTAVLRVAAAHGLKVTARGSGTGLSGAAVPASGGLVISFERMNRVLEIDTANHAAVVQPGVTLAELDEAAAAHGLVYPVYPGEMSASLGGTIATNAGGMRAVKYGVTRRHVLGLEAVLASGEVLRTGGKYRQGEQRVRPHPADHRLGGHPRAGHPGHGPALPAAARPGHRAGAVPVARRSDRRRPGDREQRHRAAHPRVHRHGDDVRDHRERGHRPRDPRGHPGQGTGLPGRGARGAQRRAPGRGHRGAGRPADAIWAPRTSMCCPPRPRGG